MTGFEWDRTKDTRNRKKHLIDFATAAMIWENAVFERIDERRDYGETRIVAIGVVQRRVLSVVFTWRGEARRIISARKANSREKALYEAYLQHSGGGPSD